MAEKQNPIRKTIKGIASLFIGMRISGKYLFKKTATVQYPDERKTIPSRFRGILINDVPRCIVCDLCAKVCPVDCIDIKKERGADKKFVAEKFDIDLIKCLFCGLCTEACPTECLTMEGGYEGAVFDKKDLMAHFVKQVGEKKFSVYSKAEGWITFEHAREIAAKEEEEKKKNAPPKPTAPATTRTSVIPVAVTPTTPIIPPAQTPPTVPPR